MIGLLFFLLAVVGVIVAMVMIVRWILRPIDLAATNREHLIDPFRVAGRVGQGLP